MARFVGLAIFDFDATDPNCNVHFRSILVLRRLLNRFAAISQTNKAINTQKQRWLREVKCVVLHLQTLSHMN